MQLTDPKIIKEVLSKNGFSFKKSLGQNFLVNPSACPRMADSAVQNGEEAVIEIGPGIGVLTAELAKRAKNVVCIEIDERLRPVLPETLSEFDNVEIIFGDCMKLDIAKIIEERFKSKKVSICANLPYYITSPIIMMLLESRLPVTSITVMVQKEAAERLCAEVGSRESGAVTVAVSYYADAEILFGVGRESFMPPPNVDSAVIKLTLRDKPAVELADEKAFFRFIKACFAQRRKTLVNTVSASLGISKELLRDALSELGLPETVRSESLTIDQLAFISNYITK